MSRLVDWAERLLRRELARRIERAVQDGLEGKGVKTDYSFLWGLKKVAWDVAKFGLPMVIAQVESWPIWWGFALGALLKGALNYVKVKQPADAVLKKIL